MSYEQYLYHLVIFPHVSPEDPNYNSLSAFNSFQKLQNLLASSEKFSFGSPLKIICRSRTALAELELFALKSLKKWLFHKTSARLGLYAPEIFKTQQL